MRILCRKRLRFLTQLILFQNSNTSNLGLDMKPSSSVLEMSLTCWNLPEHVHYTSHSSLNIHKNGLRRKTGLSVCSCARRKDGVREGGGFCEV